MGIVKLEINQAVGVQHSAQQNFVAGKDAAIIAYLSEPVEINASNAQLDISRDRVPFGTFKAWQDGRTDRVLFQCRSLEECGSWPAGNYTFNV